MAREEVTLLIDGDVFAFTAASAAQSIYEDKFGFVYPVAHKAEGEAVVENMLHAVQSSLGSTHIRIVLTDPEDNWRWGISPSYKQQRDHSQRPLLLAHLKQYLRDKFGAFHWPSLEADDTLGILMTEKQEYPGARILVGKDKDFKTIPGKYHRMKDLTPGGKPIVMESTPWEARRFHMLQTLAGDKTDGFPGCPGIGMERAQRIIDDPQLLVKHEGVITRGINKGESTAKWVPEPTRDYWACIVSNYEKAGQGEAEALITARMAHILHDEDYDRKTQTVRLWTPEKLRGVGPREDY